MEDWTEGRTELCCSCTKGLSQANGDSRDGIMFQNCSNLRQGHQMFIFRYQPLIECMLTSTKMWPQTGYSFQLKTISWVGVSKEPSVAKTPSSCGKVCLSLGRESGGTCHHSSKYTSILSQINISRSVLHTLSNISSTYC